jgi:hypothetical protein
MGLNEDIAAMEAVCQRMKRLLVWENPDAYYINEAGALIRRSRDGTETVAVPCPTPFSGSIKE